MKKKPKSYYKQENNLRNRVKILAKGSIFSVLLTIPIGIVLSIAMCTTDFPEEYLSPAVLITVVLSIVLAGIMTTAPADNMGWIGGSIAGLFYMAVIMVIRWCLEGRVYMDKDIVTLLLCGTLLGTISGMAGLSLGKRVREYGRIKRRRKTVIR
ncbi:MAG: TIGR04086 family membrane protein [Ruminococcaceae bacterium]|nr:TIGR04086 family membrane protein [Oscillospiraceae bacterium]